MSRSLLLTAPLLAVALFGCKTSPFDNDIPEDIALRQFADCDELYDYASDVVLEQLVQSRYGNYWFMEGDVAEGAPTADADDAGAPSDYTTTNVQEEGVDEVDIVKTDGEFIYTTEGEELLIVKSWPAADTSLVGRVDLDAYATGLFLDGDTVVAFSSFYNENPLFGDRWWGGTRVTYIDVSDRAHPEVTRTVDFEGWMADARLIDHEAFMVLNTWMPVPQEAYELVWDESIGLPEMDWSATEAEQERIRDEARRILEPRVRQIMNDLELTELLPMYRDDAAGGDIEPLLTCEAVYRPPTEAQYSLTSVVHLDLDDGDIDATGIMSDGWTIYASTDNLYVAQTSWWWWGWDQDDLQTNIHKFHLNDGAPEYVAAGSVDGWLLDQFAMSEYDGFLRVASTQTNWWWGGTGDDEGSQVVVLADHNGLLEPVGIVDGIAPGEMIQGVRMMGERGFVVTFEQVDPLFTVDLSNPRDPRIVGELIMPGFSTYLHPVGEDHLLAVGQAGTMEGQITGLAVTMFDVSDFANPRIESQFTLEGDDWAWSEALWDHHAFTYHRDVLSIPLYQYSWDGNDYDWFSGTLVLKARPGEPISELGRVDHSDLVTQSECRYDYWGCGWDGYWYAWVRRSVYVEDNLFTLSDYGVKVNDLNHPEIEIARVVYDPR